MWIFFSLDVHIMEFEDTMFGNKWFVGSQILFGKKTHKIVQYLSLGDNGKNLTWWHILWVAGSKP